ncbi:MAG TPA: hypothetical protein VHL59_07580 [Thermoanaerobaculia bacterium]|nr:hypothetical protein [Thermoanaerobaculia bacterium]
MSSDDPQFPPPPEAKIATVETGAAGAAGSDVIAVGDTAVPALVEPETLVQGLRYLQQRIPEFLHLSFREQQSMARAAYLDREVIETGLQAADAWQVTKSVIGRSAEELRRDSDDARRWDEVERELLALAKGIADANLKRKHRLGKDILTIYSALGVDFKDGQSAPAHGYMRPHYGNMKRAYLRATRKKSRKTSHAKEEQPETAEE